MSQQASSFDPNSPSPASHPGLILVTGMSGAGKSTALKALEDLGYEVVDNLPLALLGQLVDHAAGKARPIAVGVDIRTRDFGVRAFNAAVDRLGRGASFPASILFLDCDDEVLGQRYTETRRRHPLAADRPPLDGVRHERELISPLRDRADHVIDTTQLTVHDLRRALAGRYATGLDGGTTPGAAGMSVFVTSFSYGRGLPRDADLVFDVRFLTNPFYDPALRDLPGTDSRVAAKVASDSDYEPFMQELETLLARLLPRYEREGKSYLTVAVGCTGGRHRSVHVAERLGAWMTQHGRPAVVLHRDLDRWVVRGDDRRSPPAAGGEQCGTAAGPQVEAG